MHTLVVGVGNEDRGDDGAGLLAARLLAGAWARDPPPGVRVLPWSGDPLGLLEVWRGADRLVLIDAVVSGAAPGSCRSFGPEAPFRTAPHASSHGLGLAAALGLAGSLGALPRRVEVWGIEGVDFRHGAPLSPAVAEAVLALAQRLERELAPTPGDGFSR